MLSKQTKNISWDFSAGVIIFCFFLLQCVRWSILMQGMDIYYHLLTAWGFIQSGGYSGWDFWQYAPVGRVHIYPPFFHLILAGFIKSGVNQIILAKICEVIAPCVFLGVLWNFIRIHYGSRLGFLVTLVFFSAFSFYLSLANHIPATLAFIFGILSFDSLFKNKFLRSSLLLGLCFYTHIGISWFFLITFVLYGLFNQKERRDAFFIAGLAFILALPMTIKELSGLKHITTLGLNLNESYLAQFKAIDFVLALLGFGLTLKKRGRSSLFTAFFFAAFIFIAYPYRFFSAEGYFPVILLSCVFFDWLCQKLNKKYVVLIIAVFALLISPTWSFYKDTGDNKLNYKINIMDSAFVNLLFARGRVLWFPKEYVSTADIIKSNSGERDIVFSSLNFIGLTAASLSGRATANALLPEITLPSGYNPLLSSRIIIFTQADDPGVTNKIIGSLKLAKVGENDFFAVYKNPACQAQANISKAVLPFWSILCIALLALLAFWQAGRFERRLYKFIKNV